MARSDTPSEVGSLISSLLTEREWLRRLKLHQVFLFWDEVVGAEIARYAQPWVIRGEVLWLAVSSHVWMQQLQFEKVHLLELLNARLGGGEGKERGEGPLGLTDLRFHLDPSLGGRPSTQAAPPPARPIDHEAFTLFSASLNSLPDPELREGLKRLWLAHHRGGEG